MNNIIALFDNPVFLVVVGYVAGGIVIAIIYDSIIRYHDFNNEEKPIVHIIATILWGIFWPVSQIVLGVFCTLLFFWNTGALIANRLRVWAFLGID